MKCKTRGNKSEAPLNIDISMDMIILIDFISSTSWKKKAVIWYGLNRSEATLASARSSLIQTLNSAEANSK